MLSVSLAAQFDLALETEKSAAGTFDKRSSQTAGVAIDNILPPAKQERARVLPS